jgi:ubiquinone/menaquinone biosynthesis C-methylase UbiE
MTADKEKSEYEYNWARNATSYSDQGCYDWMAKQLDTLQPRKVFDVGCGTGEGLLVLSRLLKKLGETAGERLLC